MSQKGRISHAPAPLQLPAECVEQNSPSGASSGVGLRDKGGNNSEPRCSQSTVASAIQALPLDVGTAVYPTLTVHLSDCQVALCSGGPGNRKCGLEVKTHQQGVQCDICMRWHHAQCQDVFVCRAYHDFLLG